MYGGPNRGTHHGDYSDVPQQLLEGGSTAVAKPLHPYMDPKRQVTKALRVWLGLALLCVLDGSWEGSGRVTWGPPAL